MTLEHAMNCVSTHTVAAVEAGLMDFVLAGLDGLATGLALIDDGSRILYVNPAARNTLQSAGWSISGKTLECHPFRDQDAWLRALQQVCRRRQRQLFGIELPSGRNFAALSPVALGDLCHALVTFGRGELCGMLELQLFASQHGLTWAESQVLRKLVMGLRPSQIASDHGVAVTTVITQVAAVRSKTGSTSVRQLLATLSQLPAVRPAIVAVALGSN